MYKKIALLTSFVFYFNCVGIDINDDFIEPTLRITSGQIISFKVGQSFQFQAKYFDTSGTLVNNPNLIWTSSPPDALTISNKGLATATKSGQAIIQVSVITSLGTTITDKTSFNIMEVITTETSSETISNTTTSTSTDGNDVIVTVPNLYQGIIRTTSNYKLSGSYEYGLDSSEKLVLNIAEDYEASTSLPGLYLYLSNNPNSTIEAYEIAKVTVYNGAHSYTLPSNIQINDYKYILYWCKPFNIKVGDSSIF